MTMKPVEVMKAILDNPYDIENVRALTTPDVTYVSLNYDNQQLKRVMPWCGTAQGPDAIVRTFVDVARFWAVEAFEPRAVFGDDEHAAMAAPLRPRTTASSSPQGGSLRGAPREPTIAWPRASTTPCSPSSL